MDSRKPVVVPATVKIEAKPDHVVMIVPVGAGTVGIRFVSPDHLLGIMKELIDTAAKVWPENKWMKEYLED